MSPYEEKLEAIAEARNEHEQIEKHFLIPDGMFMSNGILYCGTCNRAMSPRISDTPEECERLARIATTQKEHIKKLQRACKKWFDKARENKKEVIKLLTQIDKLEHELKAEQKMREYWREEYYKKIGKE